MEANSPISYDSRKRERKKVRKSMRRFFKKQTFGLDIEFGPYPELEYYSSEIEFHEYRRTIMDNLDDTAHESWMNYYSDERKGLQSALDDHEEEEPDEELEYEHDRWERRQSELQDEINDWEPSESFESWLADDNWQYHVDEDVMRNAWERKNDGDARNNARRSLRGFVDEFSEIFQNDVDEDQESWEIRTKILTRHDIPLLQSAFEELSRLSLETAPNTSAHIHVGYPDKFNIISELNLFNLVDEYNIICRSGRDSMNLAQYAKRSDLIKKAFLSYMMRVKSLGAVLFGGTDNILPEHFYTRASNSMRMDPDNEWPQKYSHYTPHYSKQLIDNKVFFNYNEMRSLVSMFFNERRQGVNLTNRDHVEFRWLTSQMIDNTNDILSMIDYFMTIVGKARSEKAVTFTNESVTVIIQEIMPNYRYQITIK